VAAVRPTVICCLGATAAEAVLGPGAKVGQLRGQLLTGPDGYATAVTVHPSSVLRGPPGQRREALDGLVKDLTAVAEHLHREAAP
jgi:DNA polymerase